MPAAGRGLPAPGRPGPWPGAPLEPSGQLAAMQMHLGRRAQYFRGGAGAGEARQSVASFAAAAPGRGARPGRLLTAHARHPQADNISTILKASNITVEPYWPSLFAKLFSKKSMDDLITNVGAGA